jgi:hypothetical protein
MEKVTIELKNGKLVVTPHTTSSNKSRGPAPTHLGTLSDSELDDFITECCVIGDEYSAWADELYQKFYNWSQNNGKVPCSQCAFGRRMRAKGFINKKYGYKYYLGISLN